jgi:hypothetical protein
VSIATDPATQLLTLTVSGPSGNTTYTYVLTFALVPSLDVRHTTEVLAVETSDQGSLTFAGNPGGGVEAALLQALSGLVVGKIHRALVTRLEDALNASAQTSAALTAGIPPPGPGQPPALPPEIVLSVREVRITSAGDLVLTPALGCFGNLVVRLIDALAPHPAYWEAIGGDLASGPAATLNAPGGLVAFARGNDGAIWHTWQSAMNGNWSAWESLGGSFTDAPGAALYADGRLNVFGRGTDGAIWTRWQTTPNGDWSDWESIGGSLASGPAATLNANGGLVVFARGTDGAIWHTWQDAMNGNWSAWESLGGNFTDAPGAALYRDGRLNAFARNPDGTLSTRWQTSPNGDWVKQ